MTMAAHNWPESCSFLAKPLDMINKADMACLLTTVILIHKMTRNALPFLIVNSFVMAKDVSVYLIKS